MKMIKELFLVRHAKSLWGKTDLEDRERPISEGGKNDAVLVCKYVKNKNYCPDSILVSPAVRTCSTCDIFVKKLDFKNIPLEIVEDLYDFSGENLTKTLIQAFQNYNKVMIFGHNDAVTNFVNKYSNARIDNVPTCGFSHIMFEMDKENPLKEGKLMDFVYPSLLR